MTTKETKEKELVKEIQLREFNFKNTNNILKDVCSIIDRAKEYAYQTVNVALIKRNWLIGYRIAEEELKGENRAEYGEKIIKKLSKELSNKYGKGFDRSNLYRFLEFYKAFPRIVDSLSRLYIVISTAPI